VSLLKNESRPGRAPLDASSAGAPMGSHLSFLASEAYKLLRTNLMFSFSDDARCRVIGLTSAARGEGKSTTAIHLAFSLAEAGKKVLLIESDLRIPSIGRTLSLCRGPGLSNYLAGMTGGVDEAIRTVGEEEKFDVLLAGDVPPNPSELLGSHRMRELMESLKCRYEYIVVDLPPVTVVSDPLVISKLLSGIIVVVRHDYVERQDLDETIRQLQFANVRILGFVYNASASSGSAYDRRYRNHNKYGKQYEFGDRRPVSAEEYD